MSEKFPKLDFLKNKKSLRYATGLVIAAIALSGCTKETKPTAANDNQVDIDPRVAALYKFREDITKEGRTRFLMGACVAWPNQLEGITVTINPGIVEAEGGEGYFVFSAIKDKSAKNPKVTLMNGPELGDTSVLTLAYNPKVNGDFNDKVKGKIEKRKNGQVTYVDEVSGKTLANTAILPNTPPVVEIVEETCTALRKDQKIPKVSVDLPDESKVPTV